MLLCKVEFGSCKQCEGANLAGLLGFGFDTNEHIKLFHQGSNALRFHLDVLFDIKHQHQWQAALQKAQGRKREKVMNKVFLHLCKSFIQSNFKCFKDSAGLGPKAAKLQLFSSDKSPSSHVEKKNSSRYSRPKAFILLGLDLLFPLPTQLTQQAFKKLLHMQENFQSLFVWWEACYDSHNCEC